MIHDQLHIPIYLEHYLEANKIAARCFCTLVSIFHSIFHVFLYGFLTMSQACIKHAICAVLSFCLCGAVKKVSLLCSRIFILFCTHVHTNMGTYVGAHNIKEMFLFCGFCDRAEPFPKKTLFSHNQALLLLRKYPLF